jgi:8-oxo-dGTP pyrophosphatase MutT (NUDIX family)
MICERSCGAVVFCRVDDDIKYVLIQSLTGTYGFPKGHMEKNETEEQTALREVFEEVGLKIDLIPNFRCEDEYPLPKKKNTIKRVVYFLGEYRNQAIVHQQKELADAFLVDFETAMKLLQFEGVKRILIEANTFLSKKRHNL